MKKLTFEKFNEVLNFMKEEHDKEEALNKAWSNICYDGYGYVFSGYESKMASLLSYLMDDSEDDNIGYYIWALDYGRKWKPGTITDKDGKDIPMGTPEQLWKVLMELKDR